MATNSEKKIKYCKFLTVRAKNMLARSMNEIEGGSNVYESLVEMSRVLEAPEDADLQPLFDLSKAVISKVNEHQRSKSERSVLRQFEQLTHKVNRYAPKMADGDQIQARMANVAADIAVIEEIENLQPFFVFFKEIWAVVNDFENSTIRHLVIRARDGWMGSDNRPGRYAEPFEKTGLALAVSAWLANKPLSQADHREFKVWRQGGFDLLKGSLDHPWGMCPCGKEKILPWQDKKGQWKVGDLGHECYHSQTKVTLAKATPHVPKKKGSARDRHEYNGKGKSKTKTISQDGKKHKKCVHPENVVDRSDKWS